MLGTIKRSTVKLVGQPTSTMWGWWYHNAVDATLADGVDLAARDALHNASSALGMALIGRSTCNIRVTGYADGKLYFDTYTSSGD